MIALQSSVVAGVVAAWISALPPAHSPVAEPPASPAPSEVLAEAEALRETGRHPELVSALITYQQAAAAARAAGDQDTHAAARLGRARTLLALGRADEAVPALEKLVSRLGEGPPDRLTEALTLLADTLGAGSRGREALPHWERLGTLHEEAGRGEAAGAAHLRAADVSADLGDLATARTRVNDAHRICREHALPELELGALERLAELQARSEGLEDPAPTWGQAIALAGALGDARREARYLCRLSDLFRELADLDEAITLAETAAARASEAGASRGEAVALERLAHLRVLIGEPRAAAEAALAAIARHREARDRAGEARGHLALGEALHSLSSWQPALSAMREAESLLRDAEAGDTTVRLHLGQARALAAVDEFESASDAYEAVLRAIDEGPPACGPLVGPRPARHESPRRGRVVAEYLAVLARAELWSRALDVASTEVPLGAPPSLERLRDLARSSGSPTLLHWFGADALWSWLVLTDGQVAGARAADAAPAHRVLAEAVLHGTDAARHEPGRRAARALRALHRTFIAPIEEVLEADGSGRLLITGAADRAPWALAVDRGGERLGRSLVVATVGSGSRSLPERRAGGTTFVAPRGSPPWLSSIHAASSPSPPTGTAAARATGADGSAGSGLPRGASLVSVLPGATFLTGAAATPATVTAASEGAACLVLAGTCDAEALPDRAVAGRVVLLPDCAGASDALRDLVRRGARTAIAPHRDLTDAEVRRFVTTASRHLAGGAAVDEALRQVAHDGVTEPPLLVQLAGAPY